MKFGFIGLGRMGYNMCLNLLEHRHKPVVYDVNAKAGKQLARKGAIAADSLADLVGKLSKPRFIWLMIPAGKPVDDTLKELVPLLNKGDVVVDGGNSFYKDSIKRYNYLKKKGIKFLDCGTSCGVSGARHGACMMVGGDRQVFKRYDKLFKDMCKKNGYGYMGKAGAGHFVKGVHNAIEYGFLGALQEGFTAIEKQKKKFGTDPEEAARIYANASIIQGKLTNLVWDAYSKKGFLDKLSCVVPKGETEDEMKHLDGLSHMPVLHAARKMRVDSRKGKACGKLIAAVRNLFGGHKVIKK